MKSGLATSTYIYIYDLSKVESKSVNTLNDKVKTKADDNLIIFFPFYKFTKYLAVVLHTVF